MRPHVAPRLRCRLGCIDRRFDDSRLGEVPVSETSIGRILQGEVGGLRSGHRVVPEEPRGQTLSGSENRRTGSSLRLEIIKSLAAHHIRPRARYIFVVTQLTRGRARSRAIVRRNQRSLPGGEFRAARPMRRQRPGRNRARAKALRIFSGFACAARRFDRAFREVRQIARDLAQECSYSCSPMAAKFYDALRDQFARELIPRELVGRSKYQRTPGRHGLRRLGWLSPLLLPPQQGA